MFYVVYSRAEHRGAGPTRPHVRVRVPYSCTAIHRSAVHLDLPPQVFIVAPAATKLSHQKSVERSKEACELGAHCIEGSSFGGARGIGYERLMLFGEGLRR